MTQLRLCYQTFEFGKIDIHVCSLRDRQEFHDPDDTAKKAGINSAVWSLFGVVWPSSLVLAHHMEEYPTGSKRILEMGCGTAITSLLLNKKNADITATDYHPEAEKFLQRNTELNNDQTISFIRADWSIEKDELGLFDVIIGSDLLYEDEHIERVANFINNHANPSCDVIIVDPGRGRKTKLEKKMIRLGYASSLFKPANTEYLEKEFKGHILSFSR